MNIDTLYAYVDDTEGNGIVAARINGAWVPLIFSNLTPTKEKFAQDIATQLGKKLTLYKFTNVSYVRDILP